MGIEYSPKISDFRANGILGLESVDFFDTLRGIGQFQYLFFEAPILFFSFNSLFIIAKL